MTTPMRTRFTTTNVDRQGTVGEEMSSDLYESYALIASRSYQNDFCFGRKGSAKSAHPYIDMGALTAALAEGAA
jgi:hypothetical protein